MTQTIFNMCFIPRLIGPTQYEQLLRALGVDVEKEGLLSGEHFARLVAGKAAGEIRRNNSLNVDLAGYFSDDNVVRFEVKKK